MPEQSTLVPPLFSTRIRYFENGTTQTAARLMNGEMHSHGGLPSYQEWDESGCLTLEEWHTHGVLHREDGPAKIAYHPDSTPLSMFWILNGAPLQRPDSQPNTMIWFSGGEPRYHKWSDETGLLHREDGPAVRRWVTSPDGKPTQRFHDIYYLRGRPVHPEQFQLWQDVLSSGLSREMASSWMGWDER